MAINFPTSLDNFTNPVSGNTLDSPSHSLQHSDINDAVEALERKVGLGTAVAGSASAGQVLTISAAGTSTWSTPTPGGLVQLIPSSVAVGSGSGSVDANGAVTFSAASSISLNGAFTSTYDHYRIILNISTNSAGGYLNLRLRASNADLTTSDYFSAVIQAAFGSTALGNDNGGNSQSTWNRFGYLDSSLPANIQTDLSSPYLSQYSFFTNYNTRTGYGHQSAGGVYKATTPADGITIYPASGTITGTVRVYGYKN